MYWSTIEWIWLLVAEYLERCFDDESINEGNMKLYNSRLGFVTVSGASKKFTDNVVSSRFCNFTTLNIDNALRRFWEIEKSPMKSIIDVSLILPLTLIAMQKVDLLYDYH